MTSVDAAVREVADQPLDDRHVADRQHRLRDVVGQRPQPGAEPADEDDGAHQPPCGGDRGGRGGRCGRVVVRAAHPSWCRPSVSSPWQPVVGRRPWRAVTIRRADVSPGTASSGRSPLVDGTQRRQIGRPRRLRDVGVLGHEGDGEDHAVVRRCGMSSKFGDVASCRCRCRRSCPRRLTLSSASLPSHLVSPSMYVLAAVLGRRGTSACRWSSSTP